MKTTSILGVFCLAVVVGGSHAVAADPPAKEKPAAVKHDLLQPDPEALEAWKDMRFGMFICWGPVSLTGHEIGWSRGRETPIEQ